MKYKKFCFFYLEQIETKKIEKITTQIQSLYLKKKENNKQLKLLDQYEKEYILTMNNHLSSGIFIYQWKNYNNFIFLLGSIIRENKIMLEENQKLINEKLKNWFENHKKLKIWQHLNNINKKQILKIKQKKEQILYNDCVQLKFFQKGK